VPCANRPFQEYEEMNPTSSFLEHFNPLSPQISGQAFMVSDAFEKVKFFLVSLSRNRNVSYDNVITFF
jgi:hypothetical protein